MPMTSIDLKPELWEKVKIAAIKKKTTMRHIIELALESYFKQHKQSTSHTK